MSDTLDTLVRLTKFELDEKRRALKFLQDQEDATYEAIKKLEDERIFEASKAKNDVHLLQAYGAFAAMAKKKIAALHLFLTELSPQLETAREELATTFGEYKKVEISRDNRRAKELEEQNHKEQKEMDDLGMQGHRRKLRDKLDD